MSHFAYKYHQFCQLTSILGVLALFVILLSSSANAQNDTSYRQASDTIPPNVIQLNDSVTIHLGDSATVNDTLIKKAEPKKSSINAKVEYSATDSISLDVKDQKVFMYREADIKYEKIQQKAAFIMIDFKTSILTAQPKKDSTGKEFGKPEFTEGDQTFKSQEMRYNFRTRKGFVKSVMTQEDQGYLHGEVVKKMQDNTSNMRGGGFTTCNLEHPHFALRFTKAKVIPNNKIVTGPAYMTIEDVPIPIILPFGLFPNNKGQTSGVLVPTYGESRDRGFYLENGGYYFGINDYMELKLIGDIYSRGSWAVKPIFNYKKRYKFSGSFNLNYAINTSGIRETNTFSKKRDYSIQWTHRQDPKARPKSQFNASVNFKSTTFNRYNPVSRDDLLTNTFGSSVSYSTSFYDKVNLTAAFTHSQNTSNKTVNLTLPRVSLSVNRFYPLRKPGKASDLKWYDNISMQYTADVRNEVDTYDSLLFTRRMMDGFRNGVQHRVPVSLTLKVLRYLTFTNSIEFNERWYSTSVNQTWVNDTLIRKENTKIDTIVGYVRVDTIAGFKAAHEYSFSSSLNTSLYGMLQFRKGPVRALRHVVRPSVSFSYRPDFGSDKLGYFRTVQTDTKGNFRRYSIFGNDVAYRSVIGVPTEGESGRLNFGISNNLEMKVRSKKDTITGMKKVMLIESLNIGTSYDLARDSLQWSPLSLNARTTLFKKLQVTYAAVFDPYIRNDEGKPLNQFEWDVNDRLFRRDNSSWAFSLGYSFGSGKNKPAGSQTSVAVPVEEAEDIINNPESYINWNNPWSFSFSYNLRYNDLLDYVTDKREDKLIQTLGFNGNVNITPKWKVDFTSGYDFEQSKLSYTSVSVYRDLHCWEMRFNWIPMGIQKSWNFNIKVKAGILQDLKLNKKKDFRDN